MTGGVLLVMSRCTDPAREDEFNRWYNEVHVPDLLKLDHFVAAQRFKVSGRPNRNEPDAVYMALYELDTDDTAAAMKVLGEGVRELQAQGRMIDCLQATSSTTYVPITERITR
ncbi:MAG TPA: DUF4286 family protein [Dehalococcoidia bacterium]|nr:DUF4286 family protein [Dehalococcoidia bacterium]